MKVAKLSGRSDELSNVDLRHLQSADGHREMYYQIQRGKTRFNNDAHSLQGSALNGTLEFLKNTPALSLLVSPVIYSLIVPLVILDAWIWLYQAISFKAYGIAKVDRSHYIKFDRGHLQYLSWIERANCNYCGYANGLFAYVSEVASRTEQYFCPIKHAQKIRGAHSRYRNFVDYGDAEAYKKSLPELRAELHE